jgi:hypothetical protein
MNSDGSADTLRPWLRESHAPAYEAALEWLLPRCRTPEERALAPALLLLLSPLNALVVPCRPVAGSRVNFQVTLSRAGAGGRERLRLTVRAGSGVQAGCPLGERSGVQEAQSERLELWLDAAAVADDPLTGAARVLAAVLEKGGD